MNNSRIEVLDTSDELLESALQQVLHSIKNAISRRGVCHIVLSGGATPRGLYEKLALPSFSGQVEWGKVNLFFGDERCVLPDHPDSNYKMVYDSLITRTQLPKKSIHRIKAELDPVHAASLYEKLIVKTTGNHKPYFDLVLLGVGEDGHTASLFPGSDAVKEERRLVVPTMGSKAPNKRITLTLPALNAARKVIFLAMGSEKGEVIGRILNEGKADEEPLPAALVNPSKGTVHWFLDKDAAAKIKE